ncbi:MAG: cytochrome c biogenesis protein ResB [Verrucomicrobia bacterium]|nr:cytochrome c biogenesis protein ResB [Verrucomicrobiota bacterium]
MTASHSNPATDTPTAGVARGGEPQPPTDWTPDLTPRGGGGTLARLVQFFSSLRLTVVCLALALVVVFVGTLAQVEIGLYAAQMKYFRSLFVYWQVPGTPMRIPVMPGGYLVGGVLLINLICAHARRFGFRRDKLGLLLVHVGLILLLLGQLATDLLSVESAMRLTEGQSKSYSEDQRHSELAILETTAADANQVVTIPESVLARKQELRLPQLPFTIKLHAYWPNSTSVPPAAVTGPSLATQGLGVRTQFRQAPLETRMDRRNVPTAYVELMTPTGSLGTWAASLWFDPPQPVSYEGRTFELALRPVRYYRPVSLELMKFSHDKYMGTEIPKNFSSRVRLRQPETGENREVLIYMNNPLRYGGETFYQSGYDERDPRVTILQVVRNPSWLTPYFSCTLVGVGLGVQFLTHLVGFVKRKRA